MITNSNLEGKIVTASECCGANIRFLLGELDEENNNEPIKDAKRYCANCGKVCTPVEYVLVKRDKVKFTTELKIELTGK